MVVWMSILYWLHLLAMAAWVGGMVFNTIVLMPSAKEILDPPTMGRLLGSIMKRLRRIVYICIAVLILTGIFMMLNNRAYPGTMDFSTTWAKFMLAKHIVVAVMVIMVIYSFEVLGPKVGRTAAAGPSPKLAALQKLQLRLAMLGLILALIVLLLTGIESAISALP